MDQIAVINIVCVAGIGFLISWCATAMTIRFSRRGWGLDQPDNHRKNHGKAVSRLGGAPIFLVFVIAAISLNLGKDRFVAGEWSVLFTASLMFLVGFVDDLYPLGAKLKLGGQILVSLLAWSLGLGIDQISNPFGVGSIELPMPVSMFLTLGWFVAITNIINLVDGMDGLAGGICLLLCVTLAIVGASSGDVVLTVISVAMAGATLGFLFFNFPPAKIFLGDGGAYFLGFLIAALSLMSSQKGSIIAALLVVVVALGLPILDTAFAIIRRGIRGMPLFRADADHIHHRLLGLGLSPQTALFTMYGICAALAVIGLSVSWTQGLSLPIIIVGAGMFFLLSARYLGYVESWKTLRDQLSGALRHRREVQFAIMVGDVLEIELDRCRSAEEFWSVFWLYASRLELFPVAENVEALGRRVKRHDISLRSGSVWTLFSPVTPPTSDGNWRNVISIIEPAYVQAKARWGDHESMKNSHLFFRPLGASPSST